MTTFGQGRNAYPAFRIFVFGQEVTFDVLSCTVNWADDTRAPSTAQFTISDKPSGTGGATSRYVIQRSDIMALYPNDLTPVNIELPDVRQAVGNDPRLLAAVVAIQKGKTTEDRLSFLRQTQGLAVAEASKLLEQGAQIHARIVNDYVTRVGAAEYDLRRQVLDRVQTIPDEIKRRVLTAKLNARNQIVSQPELVETGEKAVSSTKRAAYLQGEAPRYLFWANGCIFNSGDPVRIFWRDPFNLRAWYYMFTGFVSDVSKASGLNGERTFTITCEDVLRTLRYSRTSTNPGIFDIKAIQQDEDFVTRTFFSDDFTGLTITELLFLLIFGPERPGLTDILVQQGNLSTETARRLRGDPTRVLQYYSAHGGYAERAIPRYGVGAFNYDESAVLLIGPDSDSPQESRETSLDLIEREVRLRGTDALAVYQALVDHQVKVGDLGEKLSSDFSLQIDSVTGQPTIDSVITAIGENPHLYPVDGGRLFVLAPTSLGPGLNRNILEKDIRGPELQTTYKTRLGIILDVLSRIEFSFYATPRGDIVAEMPLYDFDPADFGESDVSISTATKLSTDAARLQKIARSSQTHGPFAPHYRVLRRDIITANQTLADEHVRTQMRCDWYNIAGLKGAQTSAAIGYEPAVATIRALVPQFGARIEQVDAPAFIASKAAAEVYAHLKLNQWNAEALTSQVDMIPMLRMGPNRPLEIDDDGPYIATVRSVSRTIDWNGRRMTQTTGVNYTRVWDGLMEGNVPVYATIGGMQSRTLNYAALFRFRQPESGNKTRGTTFTALGDADLEKVWP